MKTAIAHLNKIVDRKRDVFEPSVVPRVDYKNILMLSYYRNNLNHFFINEAYIACSLFGFGHQIAWKEGVPKLRLWEQIKFLCSLIGDDFIIKDKITTYEDFERTLNFMAGLNCVEIDKDNKVKVILGMISSRLLVLKGRYL